MQIWKSILTEEPDFGSSAWKDVSDRAKDLVRLLLNKCVQICLSLLHLSSSPDPVCTSLLSLSACQTGWVCRDPKQRPTAKEALNHVWLSGGNSAERARGKPLQETVVQRIQVSKSPFAMQSQAAMASPIRWDSGSALAASFVQDGKS